ncbi:MAG TPA: D-glycero-beta-D-manno-heptose-7-phosphate kinase [bacterium]|nr:D-glycero-beta-D-manno-heptose-7-phosphate kinase [bacterium]HEX68144.1 D-glycero-beta-D-manno-heptose-7-phosphate kinase [bacterium]
MNLQEIKDKLIEILHRFSQVKVLVVGDVILDRYIKGKVERISPEAPVPVVEVMEEEIRLGGAANVASNIKSLGGEVFLVGIVGKDEDGKMVQDMLREKGIEFLGVEDSSRPTTIKERVIAHAQQIVRLDRELKDPIEPEVEKELRGKISQIKDKLNVVVISDYAKGVVTPSFMKFLKGNMKNSFLIADPKVKNMLLFQEFYLVTPNLKETILFLGEEGEIPVLAKKLKDRLRAKNILVTLGEEGMYLEGEEESGHIPAHAREVFDVTGAGDTVVGIMALGIGCGAPLKYSCVLSNLGAGIVVGKLGTAQPTIREMEEAIEEFAHEIRNYL